VNRLGVTVDYMLSDAVPVEGPAANNLMTQLLHDRPEDEKMLAVHMVKLMFAHLDGAK
jgi:hypothetical protein